MITCPSCKGKGSGWGFMCGPSGDRVGEIPCSRCKRTGEITEEHAQRIEVGNLMHHERIARGVTLREEAKRLGANFGEWSRIEYGSIPETEDGRLAFTKRMQELFPAFKEFRRDGWPFCPVCEEEELYSNRMLVWNGEGERPTLKQCIESGVRCYRCSWDSLQATASASALSQDAK